MEETPKPQSILDAVQHEVNSTSSPLLDFLTSHSRLIIACIIGFIILIGIYWGYTSYQEKQRIKWQETFGTVITKTAGEARIEALKSYLAEAPKEFHTNSYLAIIKTALDIGKPELTLEAWNGLAALDPTFQLEAAVGKANAQASMGKFAEATELLQAKAQILEKVPTSDEVVHTLAYVYARLAIMAELAGKKDIALATYKLWLALPEGQEQKHELTQKISDLETKI